MGGPCTEWVTLGEAQADPNSAGLDAATLQDGITVASEILYRLSGQQFAGVCQDVVRPTRRHYYLEHSPPQWWRWEASLGIYVCSTPPERFSGCAPLSEITLGAYPIRDVLEVRIDGQIVPSNQYRVDDRRWLVRVGTDTDENQWPCCQSLELDPLTDVGTFEVTFEWGQAPPHSGVVAARRLGIELAKSFSGNPCQLPERIQNVLRAGRVLYAPRPAHLSR